MRANRCSAGSEISPLANEIDSTSICESSTTTRFEEWSYDYDGGIQASSNDVSMQTAIMNYDNSNETSLNIATSSSKAASNNLIHCSLNNENSIDNLRLNKTSFNSFQSVLALIDWGQTLMF